MPASISAQSYYQATANARIVTSPLAGDVSTDVCVIGAGYTGLSAALELAKAGFKVVVLEAETIGFGASGRNGGQICTGFSSGQSPLDSQLGKAASKLCFDMAEESKRLIEERIAAYKIKCDLTWGYMHCIPKAHQFEHLKEMAEEYEALGYGGNTLLTKAELEEKLGSKAYHGALRESRAGHFHPLNYCLGLATAAQNAGVTIHEHSAAIEIETGAKPYARTTNGKVTAKFMVIAGNAYLGRTVKPLYGRVMPVASYILATEPLGKAGAEALIRDNEAVANTNFIVDYYRRSSDHRMLFGGRASYSTLEPGNLAEYMRPRMTTVFPQLKDVKIDYAWGGFIAITSNRVPDCGRLSPTVYYAHGYSGQGVALSGLYGKLMAEAIRGQAERFDLFARIKHLPFPGGPALRTPLLVAAMAYYRIRDALS
ncbi:NAD(P)/FAD-dependent oxidoreductase [Aestuariivirga litoralis]|uniref:NAD(P)/FAD-dependent oxidoreductase n=1 Tax=Aestuariivirga litoralis TaxID=2650924 RepID=UPI0018C81ACE|nr:FAD-binding oxidoreductase [Aestuariivirga litoralis]MBG1231987.1 FAD-binding oxidoreductase [Aestuariivirga litoralis]